MEMTALLAALVLGATSLVYDDPAPGKGESGYRVSVDGVSAVVSDVRCSAMPFNRRWPGHQRDISQSEPCGFVRFALSRPVEVAVTVKRAFTKSFAQRVFAVFAYTSGSCAFNHISFSIE